MSFLQGISVSSDYHELSPLDRAINAYTNKATRYFDQLNEAENAPKDVRKKRKQQLQEAKTHLEHALSNFEYHGSINGLKENLIHKIGRR